MLFLVTMFKWNQQLLEYYWRRRNMKREIITSVKKSETKAGSFFFCCFGNFLFQKMISDGNTFPVARRKLGGDSTALPNAAVNSTRWKLVTKSLIFFPFRSGSFFVSLWQIEVPKILWNIVMIRKTSRNISIFQVVFIVEKKFYFRSYFYSEFGADSRSKWCHQPNVEHFGKSKETHTGVIFMWAKKGKI